MIDKVIKLDNNLEYYVLDEMAYERKNYLMGLQVDNEKEGITNNYIIVESRKDLNGNVKIEAIYDMVTELNNYGFAAIKKDNKWGVIDSEAEILVEPSYEIEWDEPEFIGPYVKLNFGYGLVYYTKDLNKE